jgi:succinate-semialdehyde dehydrogenase / glutarate-semialdehyde dehydrogenase
MQQPLTTLQSGGPLGDARLFRQACYIDGAWVEADSGETIEVIDPGSGSVLGTVPKLGAAETRRAIEAADRAWAGWREMTALERGAILRRLYDLMIESRDDLGLLMTLEQGKPLKEAKGEIDYAASFIDWFADEGKRAYGDVIPQHRRDSRIVVIKQPVGVSAAITPWNFPSAMITRKCGPALAAGCPVVIKPASQTPFSALALAELAERAGVPAGIFNVVTGSASEIGGELTSNPIVRKVSFTGSTEVGKQLMAQSAATVKKISLELGGNAPFLVLDDADVETAVEAAMIGKFRNTGQSCVAVNRFLIEARLYDAFADSFTERVKGLTTGNGLEDGVEVGPLIDMRAIEKVEDHIRDALEKGAKVLTGGRRHPAGGTLFEPTVLSGCTREMKVHREETFGPVASLFRVESEADAIALANDTRFGLAAYLCARDAGRIWRVGEALEYGMVGINTGLISTALAPFGGVKESGLGREGSKYGLDEFLEVKYLCMSGI